MAMFLTGLCGIADGVLQYVGKGNKTLYSWVIQMYRGYSNVFVKCLLSRVNCFIIYYVMKYRKILIKYNAYISQP